MHSDHYQFAIPLAGFLNLYLLKEEGATCQRIRAAGGVGESVAKNSP